jgi:Ca2+-binding RTX toxin-like protein
MTTRTVGRDSTYSTIAAAVAASDAGDTISLEQRYSNERGVLITVQDLTVIGGARSHNIELVLDVGIDDVTLDGLADISVRDNSGSNFITGNGGNNRVYVSGGADEAHGGEGHDRLTVLYGDSVTSVVITASSVTDGGSNSVTFDGFEAFEIYAGSAADTLTVGDGHHWLNPGSGNDTVTTGDGNNRISLGDGNDSVTTGSGKDTISTGDGDDTVVSGAGADIVEIDGGTDAVDAGAGRDQLQVYYGYLGANVTVSLSGGNLADGYSGLAEDSSGNSVSFTGVEDFLIATGSGHDNVRTGAGRDTLRGGSGNDTLRGGGGNDTLSGGWGDDTLVGGGGQDHVVGDEGDDTLVSSRGRDVLIGDQVVYRGGPPSIERGADTFRFDDLSSGADFSETDTIMDLDSLDTIDLSRIDADVTTAGDQAFVIVDSFSGTAGEGTLTKNYYGTATTLSLDTDGDRAADIMISLVGDHRAFDNFVL